MVPTGVDIALGKQGGPVEQLGKQLGARTFKEAAALGKLPNARGWGGAFVRWMNKIIGGGGKVHFELNGVDLNDAVNGNPATWFAANGTRYAEWELQTIMRRRDYFTSTSFYMNGNPLDFVAAEALGVKLRKIGGHSNEKR